MTGPSAEPGRAAELRREFDRTFAQVRPASADAERLLGIRVRGEPYAVRLSEVTALLLDRRIQPLPGPSRELLGLTGVRGVVVPVYDLGALLGHAPLTETPRFLLVAGAGDPVGLGFEQFDGYLGVERSQIASPAGASAGGTDGARAHCREVAQIEGQSRGVILIHSIMTTITERVAALRVAQER